MLIWTTHLSKRKAVAWVIGLGLVMALAILVVSHMKEPELPPLTDNPQRVAYLYSLGWEVTPDPVETLQFLMPAALEEPYRSYNHLQLEAGFDLEPCCGQQVSRYTYAVTNYPQHAQGVQVNLYVCQERPVAGDLCCPGADGFQIALAPRETIAPES